MQNYRFIFSILSVLFLIKPPASAQTAADLEQFSQTYAQKWQFVCNIENLSSKDSQQFVEFYESNAKQAVFRGLTDLRTLNWDLYVAVYRRTNGKKLMWGCDFKSFMNNDAAAYYNKYPIGLKGIRLGVQAAQFGLNCQYGKRDCVTFQNTLLHEFYHYAGLDNMNFIEHKNQHSVLDNFDKKIEDVIYSCAAQTFPTRDHILEIRNGSEALKNSKRICTICATAVADSGRWGTKMDMSLINSGVVAERCSSMDEEKHFYGYIQKHGDSYSIETPELRNILKELEAMAAANEIAREKLKATINSRPYTVTREKKKN